MIQFPSAQNSRTEYYSGDAAFVQLADNATPEEAAEYRRKLRVARQTGDWSALRIDGGPQPSKFTMRPIPSEIRRRLEDKIDNKAPEWVRGLPSYWLALVFRASFESISNFDDYKFETVREPQLGGETVAHREIVELLDRCTKPKGLIVNELAIIAWQRTSDPDPT